VQRKGADNVFATIASLPTGSVQYADTTLSPGTYAYRVYAFDASGKSNYSNETQPLKLCNPPVINVSDLLLKTDSTTCSKVITLDYPTIEYDCGEVTITGTRSDGEPLQAPLAKGITTINWTATAPTGLRSSVQQRVVVEDKENPVFTQVPSNITATTDPGVCSAVIEPGQPIAIDNCGLKSLVGVRNDSLALSDHYPVGETIITWIAEDHSGNVSSINQSIVITDVEGPVIAFHSGSFTLWSPNHRYRTYAINEVISSVADNCGTQLTEESVYITHVTSDEPGCNDILISDDCKSVRLRATRNVWGNGRVYRVHVAVSDAAGNSSVASFTVKVPINPHREAIEGSIAQTVQSVCSDNYSASNQADEQPYFISIYPNPASSDMQLEWNSPGKDEVEVLIMDLAGQVLTRQKQVVQQGINQITLPVSELSRGVKYLVCRSHEREFRKIILLK
jgi:hypothetical protein